MRRRFAHILTALACALALAGCQRSARSTNSGGGPDSAEALVRTLNTFTDELLAKVEKAQDAKTGVAEAQALLDARKSELAGSVAALKRDAGAKASLLEVEVDNTDRVHRLQLKYADAAARDAELRAGLERLINDYDTLFR